MRGGAIFLAFFVVFSVASYAVPDVRLFPGSDFPSWFAVPIAYARLTGSVVNGIVYGCVVWLVFVLVSRKFEEPKVATTKGKGKRSRNVKR